MIYSLIKKIYLKYILNLSFIKKLILKSYDKLNLDDSLRSENIYQIEKRFEEKKLTTLTSEDILKKKIGNNEFKKIYILTDLEKNIESKLKNSLEIITINTSKNLKKEQIQNCLFFVLFSSDETSLNEIENIINNNGFFKSLDYDDINSNLDFSRATSYRFINNKCMHAIKKTFLRKKKITGHYLSTLNTHENICEAIELTKNLEGDYVEIGVFEGGSALTALNYFKSINLTRTVYLLDTFEGFNYKESEKSQDLRWHKSHYIDSEIKTKNFLKETLNEFKNYKLVTNNICRDELPQEVSKISLANIDVDLYEATYMALKKVSKKIVKNGIIMCEDPPNTPVLYGALYAMEKFLNSEEGNDFIKVFKKNHYFLIKKN